MIGILIHTAKLKLTLYNLGNPLVCDCELRWYKQWIESEWNEIEETWLRETTCKDMVDDKIHVISEVDLRDMFCDSDVKDKPGKVLNSFNKCCFCWGYMIHIKRIIAHYLFSSFLLGWSRGSISWNGLVICYPNWSAVSFLVSNISTYMLESRV